jgi:DeoR/GlpR family transcriptional regulator of sugar metabolism
MLPKNCKCTFFTVSPLVAMELAVFTECEVILLGGQLLHVAYIVVGSMVINQLSDLKLDLCILGTNAISIDNGISDAIWEIVQVKKAMIKSAGKTAIVSIAEKLNSVAKMKVCSLANIDYLITDINPLEELLVPYNRMVKVL